MAVQSSTRSLLRNKKIIRRGIVVVLVVMLLGCGFYVGFVAIPNKISARVGEQLQRFAPTEKVQALETKQLQLENDQLLTGEKLVELSIRFDLYFGDRTRDKAAVQDITGRAVDSVLKSKNAVERTVALRVARSVLNRASANHVVMDQKKIQKAGLSLLDEAFESKEKPELKGMLSELAKQRTLNMNAPKDQEPNYKYIIGGDQTLDGSNWQNVTFVNCNIKYGDGWLNLNNVRFINCTFDVFPENTGKEFYQALFKSSDLIPTVTVKTQGRGPDPQGRSS